MSDYRLVKNGYVPADISDSELAGLFRNLKALKTDAYADFVLVIKGHVAVETLQAVKRLVGHSFHDFLEVNFGGGRGPLAGLARDVVHFLNNRVGYLSVLTSIQEQENRLTALTRRRSAVYTPSISAGRNEVFLKDGDTVLDYDLYRLMAALGPATTGRLMLLLGGAEYYV
jgi:hypothetical protein